MSIAGHLVGVTTEELGSTLTADLTIGDTVVQVDSTMFFDEENGGTLLIGGVKLDYEAFDDPDDEDADTDGPTELTLTAASPVAASEGDPVWAFDPTTGADDPVAELVALVTIDDRDPGDAIPARIRAGLVEQLDSDFETYIGKAVELDVIDGELVLVDILGSKATGGVKAMQDETAAVGSGGSVTLDLTYIPVLNSEHLYWNGVYQPGSEWSRDAWTVTIPDPDGVFETGDELVMEYLYTDPATAPPVTYGGVAGHLHSGTSGSYPTSFITSTPLPSGTALGDLIVVCAIGDGGGGPDLSGDPRLTTVCDGGNRKIAIGKATDLSDIVCHVGGASFPLDQFAAIVVLTVQGDGSGPLEFDPTRVISVDIAPGGTVPTIGGSGHGVVAAIAGAYGNTITIDMATDMPDYTDWGGNGATSVLGNFGYCATEPPPSQTNPTNATDTLVTLIGLR